MDEPLKLNKLNSNPYPRSKPPDESMTLAYLVARQSINITIYRTLQLANQYPSCPYRTLPNLGDDSSVAVAELALVLEDLIRDLLQIYKNN